MSATTTQPISQQSPTLTPQQLQALAQVLGQQPGQQQAQAQGPTQGTMNPSQIAAMSQALGGYLGATDMNQAKQQGIVGQLQKGIGDPTQSAAIGAPGGLSTLDFMNSMTP
jgi:hypothetical protein